jgi:hypothetical protein
LDTANVVFKGTYYTGLVAFANGEPFTGTTIDAPGEVRNAEGYIFFGEPNPSGLMGYAMIRGTLRAEISDYNVGVVKLRQGIGKLNQDGSCCADTNDGNPPWEAYPYDNLAGKTIYELGCWLTSLSMALNSEGIHLVPTSYCGPPLTAPAACPGPVLVPNDPGSLNTFVRKPSMQYGYDSNGNIDVNDVVYALSQPSALNKANLQFNASYYDCPVSSSCTAAEDYLAGALQQGHPVIVGVEEPPAVGCDQFPCHFVLVWGKRNGEWLIADPWPTIPSATVPTPRLKLSDWGHYATRGYLSDPPNSAGLEVTTPSAVELLLTGPTGQRTGYEPTTGAIVQDTGAYFVDSVVDAAETGFATKPSRFVLVPQPADGQYSLEVTGLKLGTYSVNVQGYSQDGSIQPAVTLTGIAGPSSTSNLNIAFDTAPGATPTAVRSATAASALADVRNSLRLGLITKEGIARSLSLQIQVASWFAAFRDCRDAIGALRAFQHEVGAQTGKTIDPAAALVLTEDAAYLIAHCGSGCLR